MEIKLRSGKNIEFDSFIPKESNLIKVKLHRDNDDVEGIWACISDKDMEDYKADVNDGTNEPFRVATLRNAALAFYPANSWGLCIPIRFKGTERPEFNLEWVDPSSEAVVIETETEK